MQYISIQQCILIGREALLQRIINDATHQPPIPVPPLPPSSPLGAPRRSPDADAPGILENRPSRRRGLDQGCNTSPESLSGNARMSRRLVGRGFGRWPTRGGRLRRFPFEFCVDVSRVCGFARIRGGILWDPWGTRVFGKGDLKLDVFG